MGLEKQMEIQRKRAGSALRVLLWYGKKLAEEGIIENGEKIENLKKFSQRIACFFCVEGHEKDCDDRIMEKYVQPYERLLTGDKNALSGVQYEHITKENVEIFLSVINSYRLEMMDDYNPAYDKELKYCIDIMADIEQQYGGMNDACQRLLFEWENIRNQETGMTELGTESMGDGQNSSIIQGM